MVKYDFVRMSMRVLVADGMKTDVGEPTSCIVSLIGKMNLQSVKYSTRISCQYMQWFPGNRDETPSQLSS